MVHRHYLIYAICIHHRKGVAPEVGTKHGGPVDDHVREQPEKSARSPTIPKAIAIPVKGYALLCYSLQLHYDATNHVP